MNSITGLLPCQNKSELEQNCEDRNSYGIRESATGFTNRPLAAGFKTSDRLSDRVQSSHDSGHFQGSLGRFGAAIVLLVKTTNHGLSLVFQ